MGNFTGIKYIVVGSGFFGATLAERIANDMEQSVVVLEGRSHVGGNSYSHVDTDTGIDIHAYGSHIFHTKDQSVWKYVNQFSSFNHYRHTVLSKWQDRFYFMPINLDTINRFYGLSLAPSDAEQFLAEEAKKEQIVSPRNVEEKVLSQIGRPLYDAFFRGYTTKQWGVGPTELPESIVNRLPIRTNYNVNYFDDPFQGIPMEGYGALFERMLANPRIDVRLNTDFFQVQAEVPPTVSVVFSGPIDRFFNYQMGELSWRSLRFDSEIYEVDDFQGAAVINYAEESIPYTRIHEFKHYHPEQKQRHRCTVICKEYPETYQRGKEPFYPVNTDADQRILAQYQQIAKEIAPNVMFGGRLGAYRYFDMDQAISQALSLYYGRIKPMALRDG